MAPWCHSQIDCYVALCCFGVTAVGDLWADFCLPKGCEERSNYWWYSRLSMNSHHLGFSSYFKISFDCIINSSSWRWPGTACLSFSLGTLWQASQRCLYSFQVADARWYHKVRCHQPLPWSRMWMFARGWLSDCGASLVNRQGLSGSPCSWLRGLLVGA